MASTTFTNYVTPVDEAWLNDVNTITYVTVPAQAVTISTNTADIATNTANIATNTTDISNRVVKTSSTGSAILPVGPTEDRDSPALAGYTRFNSSYAKPEVYNGTAWTGLGGANGNGGDAVFYENDQAVTSDYTIAANKNAMSAGPITVNSGVTVTVSSGAVWTIV